MGNPIVTTHNIQSKSRGAPPWGSAAIPAAGVNAQFTPHRISGPAPLAIFFDATASTASGVSDPWKDLGYHFTFGDPDKGSWPYSGVDKNEQIGGPLATHVYEDHGTYIAKLRAEDIEGNFQDISVEIEALDPDVFYAGEDTVCISLASDPDFTGAPDGAKLEERSGFSSFDDDKRYLLRAGQDFSGFSFPPNFSGVQDFTFGRFGTGSDPIVGGVKVNGDPTSNLTFAARGKIIGIEVAGAIEMDLVQTDILVFQSSWKESLKIGSLVVTEWTDNVDDRSSYFWPKNIFLVENLCDFVDPSGANNCIFSLCQSGAFMGNELKNPDEHVIRTSLAYKMIITHNFLHEVTETAKHHIKMHSKGLQDFGPFLDAGRKPASRYNIISYNKVGDPAQGGDVNDWMIVPAPQASVVDEGKEEGLEDIIVEYNKLNNGDTGTNQTKVAMGVRRATERGNTATNGADNYQAITGVHMTDTNILVPGPNPPSWDGPYFLDAEQIIPDAPE